MSEFRKINNLIEDFFDALYHTDSNLLRKVFHPKAIYATADETPFLYRGMEEYFDVIDKRVSPASKKQPRHESIESVELAGDNTAFVRTSSVMSSSTVVDFLTLVKIDGQWLIISKVFAFVKRG